MSLTPREVAELRKIISIAEKLLAKVEPPKRGRTKATRAIGAPEKGVRRKGKELAAFRKAVLAERKKGVPVAEIARKHGITPNYIYQIT
jgi:hypothetical protein